MGAANPEFVLLAYQFLSAIFISIVVWEFMIWMPVEIYVWRKVLGRVRDAHDGRTLRVTIGEGLAVWMRYSMIGWAICVGVLNFSRPSSCQAAVSMMWAFACFGWAAISFLFTLRLYIMYNRSRVLLGIFCLCWLVALGFWIYVAATWRASRDPTLDLLGVPYCVQRNLAVYRTSNFGASMAFDLFVLVATFNRLRQLRKATDDITVAGGSSRRMKAFIMRSNLLYFLVSFLLSLTAWLVQTALGTSGLSGVMTPPAIALMPIVAIRIVFSATNDAAIEDILPSNRERITRSSSFGDGPRRSEDGNANRSFLYDGKPSPVVSMQSRRLSYSSSSKRRSSTAPAPSYPSHASRRVAVDYADEKRPPRSAQPQEAPYVLGELAVVAPLPTAQRRMSSELARRKESVTLSPSPKEPIAMLKTPDGWSKYI